MSSTLLSNVVGTDGEYNGKEATSIGIDQLVVQYAVNIKDPYQAKEKKKR